MRAFILFLLLYTWVGNAQQNIDVVLKKYNKNTIPYITVENLKLKKNVYLLDARELNEYQVSHINQAMYVGHEKFSPKTIAKANMQKQDTIVVYCSIGVRSEQIAEKIKALGYTNVYNLYGGIFDWKNKGGVVVDEQNNATENVHTYSKDWSSYLVKGKKIF